MEINNAWWFCGTNWKIGENVLYFSDGKSRFSKGDSVWKNEMKYNVGIYGLEKVISDGNFESYFLIIGVCCVTSDVVYVLTKDEAKRILRLSKI